MGHNEVRDAVRAIRHATTFAILQLQNSIMHFGMLDGNLRGMEFSTKALAQSLEFMELHCDMYMSGEHGSLQSIDAHSDEVVKARVAMAMGLLSLRDDCMTFRFMQFNFLADVLRVLHERVVDAVAAAAASAST